MKKQKIIFWISTGFLFLTQGIMPIFTYNDPGSQDAMAHLGYPYYFALMLAIFKLIGGLLLIIPTIPNRIKEWAYAGFAFDFVAAFVSLWVTDGLSALVLFPVIAMIILMISYISHHKIINLQFKKL
jgi:uncharacterized membrane protein YphA (DoxX/SURF4 family)